MKKYILPFSIVFLFFLSSCDSYMHSAAYSPPTPPVNKMVDDDDLALKLEGRRVIMNGAMTLEVERVDSTVDQLISIALKNDGYVVRSTFEQTTIRVLATNFKQVIDQVNSLGELVDQELDGQDVTDTYYDLEIRLANAEKTRDRYLQMLQDAKSINEGLAIERELERLNTTIDQLKGQLNRLNHLETYATLTVNHKEAGEKVKPGLVSYVGIGLYKSVKWLFVRN